MLAGRQDEAAALRSALEGDRNVVAVVGDLSTIEMKAFLAASLVDNPLAARTLFVNDPAGLAIGVRHVLA